jgi:hypothetical protein
MVALLPRYCSVATMLQLPVCGGHGRPQRERGKREGQRVEHLRSAVQQGGTGRGRIAVDHGAEQPDQLVEPGATHGVGRRGDHRFGAEHGRDAGREHVGPAFVAAGERHREPARLVDADDAGVGALVGEQRGDEPHGGAGGEEEHRTVESRPQAG